MSDLSPVQIERKLHSLVTDLTKAQLDLARVRDREVAAKHVYEASHRRAVLSPDCPKVTRGGVTTAERDAWVGAQVADDERAYEIAVAVREAATDHLRTLNTQSVIVAALAKSVGASYAFAGRGES